MKSPPPPFPGLNHGTVAAGSGKLTNIVGTVKTTTTVTAPIVLPTGNNILIDNEPDAVIVGGDGNQRITELGTNASITLGNGNDIVNVMGAGATIVVGNGNNEITLGAPSHPMHGGTASAIATITADTLRLGNGTNKVFIGGSGNTIYDGSGTDTFMGAESGNNTFVLNANGGTETVGGFSLTNGDKIDLSAILAGTGVTAATLANSVTLATTPDACHAGWTDTVLTVHGASTATMTLLNSGTLTLSGMTGALVLPQ